MWHLGFQDCVSDLVLEPTSYDAPSSSAQRQSKPNSNSWFSSLTRFKGKSAMGTAVQTQLITDPPPHPEIESSTPEMTTATPQPIPTPPQNIPGTSLPQPRPSSWSSSPPPPSSPPPKELAPLVIPSTPPPTYPLNLAAAATHPHESTESPMADVVLTERPPLYTASRSSNKSTLPSPCSVDDRVPSLPTTPPAEQLQHTPLKSPPLEQTTALNPSSSRFTLSIPLLGRAKVPLGSVLGKEKEKEKSVSLIHSCFLSYLCSPC